MQELLEKPLNKKEQQALEKEQKKPIIEEDHEFKQIKEITLGMKIVKSMLVLFIIFILRASISI